MEIRIGGDSTVSYSVAIGIAESRHGVRLARTEAGWTASPRGLCGAALIIRGGTLRWASCGLDGITCERCARTVREMGLGKIEQDGIVVPSWRQRSPEMDASPG